MQRVKIDRTFSDWGEAQKFYQERKLSMVGYGGALAATVRHDGLIEVYGYTFDETGD